MLKWQELIEALGTSETSGKFAVLMNAMGEKPEVSEDPVEYNDPEKSKYYKYLSQGVELTLINNNLKQIHLYLISDNDYSEYGGELPLGIDSSYDKNRIISLLGIPVNDGGGYPDKLLGYINNWIAYYIDDSYSLRFEFNQNDRFSAVTLTTLPI